MRESAAKRDNSNYFGRKPTEKTLEKYKKSIKKYWENISEERRAELALIRKTSIKKWRDNISTEDL